MTTFPIWAERTVPYEHRPDKIRIAELEAEVARLKEQLSKINPDSKVVERTKT